MKDVEEIEVLQMQTNRDTGLHMFKIRVQTIDLEITKFVMGKSTDEMEAQEEAIRSICNQVLGKADEKPKTVKKATKKKVAKKKAVAPKPKVSTVQYDREKAEHKQVLIGLLNATYPNWTESADLKKKAKSFSTEQTGKVPLYNGGGEVTSDFTKTLEEYMGSAVQ
jgi:hypothetical protein